MNEKKDKDYFKKLAQQCMFDFKEEELERVDSAFEVLENQMKLLEVVDTTGVEPMVYPFEMETTYLREDVVDHVISQEEALKNVRKVKSGHVVVPKVVR